MSRRRQRPLPGMDALAPVPAAVQPRAEHPDSRCGAMTARYSRTCSRVGGNGVNEQLTGPLVVLAANDNPGISAPLRLMTGHAKSADMLVTL